MPELYCAVTVENQNITSLVNSMDIIESDERASTLKMSLNDSHQILSDVLHEGLSIHIDLGYDSGHGTVFKGVITGIRASYPLRAEPKVEVIAMSNLILLSMEPKTKRWWNTTISQIVREIALAQSFVPSSISPGVDLTIDEYSPVQQVEETDLAFLYRLAKASGSKVDLLHGEGPDQLNFVSEMSLAEQGTLESGFTYNENLLDFFVGFESYSPVINSDLISTDPSNGDSVSINNEHVGMTDGAWTPDPERIAALGDAAAFVTALIASAAPKRAQLQNYWRKRSGVSGAPSRESSNTLDTLGHATKKLGQSAKGRASGMFELRPSKRIAIAGVGSRWNGDWYVNEARHRVDMTRNSYISEFQCTR